MDTAVDAADAVMLLDRVRADESISKDLRDLADHNLSTAFVSSSPPAKADPEMESEMERRRSSVLRGVPEHMSTNVRDRIAYDYQSVVNVLHFLKVDCLPIAVYR
ncbi:unnamed protein product [Nippostrongylus brasiliensis]|uniref:CBS domain-containing protein n=1 Tax=Nippostrongylus brasiliensis TaxID=27835 RepID=A0A0N4YC57_NIPBR|nr:unnamed protein product [Nippostrongylus brasiliensis]